MWGRHWLFEFHVLWTSERLCSLPIVTQPVTEVSLTPKSMLWTKHRAPLLQGLMSVVWKFINDFISSPELSGSYLFILFIRSQKSFIPPCIYTFFNVTLQLSPPINEFYFFLLLNMNLFCALFWLIRCSGSDHVSVSSWASGDRDTLSLSKPLQPHVSRPRVRLRERPEGTEVTWSLEAMLGQPGSRQPRKGLRLKNQAAQKEGCSRAKMGGLQNHERN